MSQLIILGSSNAIPTLGHVNTHLAVITPGHRVLVDCGGNPVISLEQAGLDPTTITDILLTHFHPDHVSGLPLLLMDMWLMGRRAPLNIRGLAYTLDRVRAMMELFAWSEWPNFYEVNFYPIPMQDMATVLDDADIRIYSSPVKHLLPNIGLRIELLHDARSIAYSCDTEPCQAVLDLSNGVDILLHEASGATPGHSSAAQAGENARRAEVGMLYLIHYPTGRFAADDLLAQARSTFPGQILLASDLMKIDLDALPGAESTLK
jgi:ribonuclease Z